MALTLRFPGILGMTFMAALAAGCTVQQAKPTGSSGGSGATAAPPALSCMKILQCAADCADGDTACEDGCLAKGDAEGKANVVALADCVEKAKCTDASCIQKSCADTLDTCITSSAPKSDAAPLDGKAPPGSVPPDLVGSWSGARGGETMRLTFNADGTGSLMTSVTSQQSACFSYNRTTKTGSMVVTDTTITVYATSVVKNVRKCAPPDVNTDLPPVTEQLTWHRDAGNDYHPADPNTIFVVDSVCAAQYPNQENCNTAGCPIGLYCTSRVTRE